MFLYIIFLHCVKIINSKNCNWGTSSNMTSSNNKAHDWVCVPVAGWIRIVTAGMVGKKYNICIF